MESLLKKLKFNNIIDGIVCVVVGLVMLFLTKQAATIIVSILAIMLIIAGIICVASFFTKHENPYVGYGMVVVGALIIILGIWILTHEQDFKKFIPMLFGVMMLVSGLSNLLQAISLSKCHYKYSWLSLVFSGATMVLGLIFIFSPIRTADFIIRIMGIILLYNGGSDLWITSRLSRYIKDTEKEIKEAATAVDVDAVIKDKKN